MWNQTYEVDREHVACPKCDSKFDTEIENKIHFHVNHKGGLEKPSNVGKFPFLYLPELSLFFFQYGDILVSVRHSVHVE
jgi:hypothetical protein